MRSKGERNKKRHESTATLVTLAVPILLIVGVLFFGTGQHPEVLLEDGPTLTLWICIAATILLAALGWLVLRSHVSPASCLVIVAMIAGSALRIYLLRHAGSHPSLTNDALVMLTIYEALVCLAGGLALLISRRRPTWIIPVLLGVWLLGAAGALIVGPWGRF